MKTMPYMVDQNPGTDSAMGVLMLDSPNDFGVYLHDTPGKALFKPDIRLKSNGCIRVEQMTALASLVLSALRRESSLAGHPGLATRAAISAILFCFHSRRALD